MAKLTLVGGGGRTPHATGYWKGKMAIVLLAAGALLYAFLDMRLVKRAAYDNQQSLVSANSRLAREVQDLTREMDDWKKRAQAAESAPAKSATISHRKSPKSMSEDFHALAGDVLDFQGNRLRSAPLLIIGGQPDLMRQSMEQSNSYNQQAIMDFLKRFGGPIESVMRRTKPYGLDISRLQSHIIDLNSIQMMRLIADDVNDLADQLDHGNLVSANGGAQKALCLSDYSTCP